MSLRAIQREVKDLHQLERELRCLLKAVQHLHMSNRVRRKQRTAQDMFAQGCPVCTVTEGKAF